MGFQPTAEQEVAIKTIDRDLVVTAGAGSGKTKVLVERYLYLLEKGFSIDSIVAITFTKKAAQEMKERIQQAQPDKPLSSARISTIHSFCQALIKDYPREAGVDPQFAIGEEWEMQALLMEIAEEAVGKALQTREEEIVELSEEFRHLRQLAETLVETYRQMASKGQTQFDIVDNRPELKQEIGVYHLRLQETISEFLTTTGNQQLTAAGKRRVDNLKELWPDIRSLLAREPLEGIFQLLEVLKGNWGKLKEEISVVKDTAQGLEQALLDYQGVGFLIGVQDLLKEIHQTYQRAKRHRSILDFNDLEQLALKVLQQVKPPEIKHLMVDEFQDTNRVQKSIIDALLLPETKLFVVGDPKQSIYRFRGAEVQVFTNTCQEIESRGGEVISLQDNFRSSPGIIRFTNEFFARLMAEDAIEYEPSRDNREDMGCNVELLLCPQVEEGKTAERRVEASLVAQRILEFLYENPTYSYKDIALLFRQTSNVAIYEEALRDQDIPFVNLSGRDFYFKQEIKDVFNLIECLLDPLDTLAEIAILRSPLFNVSDEGLYWYQLNKLDQALSTDQEKINQAHDSLSKWRKRAQFIPAPQVIEEALEETKFLEKMLVINGQAYANLIKLLQKSRKLAASGYISLVEQRNYMKSIVAQKGQEGEARLDAEHEDVVKIMTIHGSKGLEFPVVVLPDLDSRINQGERGLIGYHPDIGLGVRNTATHQRIKERNQQEELAEAKRLLYVAVTRAEDYLICSGMEQDVDESKSLAELATLWKWLNLGCSELPDTHFRFRSQINPNVPRKTPRGDQSEEGFTLPIKPLAEVSSKPATLSFSVTSLMTYAQCPRAYFYRYVLQAPEIGDLPTTYRTTRISRLTPLQRGNIVHRVCENITERSQVNKVLRWAAEMEGVILTEEDAKVCLAIINPYLESTYFKQLDHTKREVSFMLPVADFFVSGTIDQVRVEPEGVGILDFKTNNVKAAQIGDEAKKYHWQLLIYAWATNKLLNLPVIAAELYFLMPNRVYTHPTAHQDILQTEEWLKDTVQEIREGAREGLTAFPPGEQCVGCGFGCKHRQTRKKAN